MRSTIVVFATMVGAAAASCCNSYYVPGGGYPICDDGENPTPCCGVGSCNIFCCNCDGGCRKENYWGCMNIAGIDQSACEQWKPWASCASDYQKAADACAAKYPNHDKRALDEATESAPSNLFETRAEAGSCGSDLFEHVDADRDGTIGLDEYVAFMSKNMGHNFNRTLYTDYFNSFDQDGDGKIAVHETRRV